MRTMVAMGSRGPRNILVVEDEPSDSVSLRYSLEAAGYSVRLAKTIADALRLFGATPPDLVLLDPVLPDGSGLELCRRIRKMSQPQRTVIVVLSARAEEEDRVAAFELGADDFVTKPFSTSELLLRIQARLGDGDHTAIPPAVASPDPGFALRPLVAGPLRIDRDSHRVFLAQRELTLSVQEVRLLTFLASQPDRMRSRRELLTAVWGYHPDATSRTLDTHIKRLRDKFGSWASMIQTVHGVGYRFALSPQTGQKSAPSKRRR